MAARWCSLVAVIGLVASVTERDSYADPEGAERLAASAEQLATSGDFLGAAAKFREAYREYPRPDLMCNVGVAYYKAKDLPRAHRYLDQCVTSGASLDPDFIRSVKAVLAAVESTLVSEGFTPVNLIVQPQSATTTFASGVHDEPLVGPRQVWVPYGTYRVTIHAEGFVDQTLDITATSHARVEHSIKLEPAPVATKPPVDDARPLPAAPPPAPPRSLVAPIIASAATGVLGGLAIGVYVSARSSAEEANAALGSGEHREAKDQAETRQYISWGVAGVAGVAGIAAGVLWYRALRSPSRVEVSASRDSASVGIVGRW